MDVKTIVNNIINDLKQGFIFVLTRCCHVGVFVGLGCEYIVYISVLFLSIS